MDIEYAIIGFIDVNFPFFCNKLMNFSVKLEDVTCFQLVVYGTNDGLLYSGTHIHISTLILI